MLRTNLPLIVSHSPIFEEFRTVCVPIKMSEFALPRAILKLVKDSAWRQEVVERQQRFVDATRWTQISSMVLDGIDAY